MNSECLDDFVDTFLPIDLVISFWILFLRYHIDTNQLNYPKKDMEVSNYMKDGMITDWDMFEQVLIYKTGFDIQIATAGAGLLLQEDHPVGVGAASGFVLGGSLE